MNSNYYLKISVVISFLVFQLVYNLYANEMQYSKLKFPTVNKKVCSLCLCIEIEYAIVCTGIKLDIELPLLYDSSVKGLVMKDINFIVPRISRHNFTYLTNLNVLKIIRCGLTNIEPNTFFDMKNLNQIDLSYNKLKVINPYTFNGANLKSLTIISNKGIRLLDTSFANLRSATIDLRHNGISQLNYSAFANVSVKEILLYRNNLVDLDPKFQKIFEPREHFIDLSDNPLSCECNIKWIVRILQVKFRESKYKEFDYNIQCRTPMRLAGHKLAKLRMKQLECPAPKIKSIHVSFGISTTQLTCTAIGDKKKAPGISWNYIIGNDVRELRRTPLHKPPANNQNLQTSFSINITTPIDTTRAFTCTTWMENSETEKIIVNIKAPKFPDKTSKNDNNNSLVITDGKRNDAGKYNKPTLPEYHYVFKKQFTILEVVGAVIGTFTATLFLLMLVAQYLRRRKKLKQHDTLSLYQPHPGTQGMLGGNQPAPYSILPPPALSTTPLNTAHSSSSINLKNCNPNQLPYWTLGHDSNQTYTHPSSNSDYDTPRLYEHHAISSKPPSLCQSPPLNRMEFYDYKTHDRIFTS